MHTELSTAICQKGADINAVYRHRSLENGNKYLEERFISVFQRQKLLLTPKQNFKIGSKKGNIFLQLLFKICLTTRKMLINETSAGCVIVLHRLRHV